MWKTGRRFKDREEAGGVLASMMEEQKRGNAVILAVPNGGVAVGASMARILGLELGLVVVRKIQFPHNKEAGFGAVAADGTTVLDERLVRFEGIAPEQVAEQKEKALQSVRERVRRFGNLARFPTINSRTVILVDDGLATGSTMEAAVSIVRRYRPKEVIVAVPTASQRAWERLRNIADRIICPCVSRLPFFAVADAYEKWYDVQDEEVIRLLERRERGNTFDTSP